MMLDVWSLASHMFNYLFSYCFSDLSACVSRLNHMTHAFFCRWLAVYGLDLTRLVGTQQYSIGNLMNSGLSHGHQQLHVLWPTSTKNQTYHTHTHAHALNTKEKTRTARAQSKSTQFFAISVCYADQSSSAKRETATTSKDKTNHAQILNTRILHKRNSRRSWFLWTKHNTKTNKKSGNRCW